MVQVLASAQASGNEVLLKQRDDGSFVVTYDPKKGQEKVVFGPTMDKSKARDKYEQEWRKRFNKRKSSGLFGGGSSGSLLDRPIF